MVELYDKYRDKGFEILAFPCNQFMGQEPAENDEIKNFAVSTFNVRFPLFEKIEVNGENTHEVYRYLRFNSELYNKNKNIVAEIPWNFAKFLINRDGKVASFHQPKELPEELESKI
jgi:glutathione peroxidase